MRKKVGITRVLANCNLTKIKIYKWVNTKMPEKMSRSNMQPNETKILQLTHVGIYSIE